MRSVKNPARSRPLSRNVRRLMKMARESPANPEVEKIEREFTARDLAYCDMQGNIFMAAIDRGIPMETFAPVYMNSQLAGVIDYSFSVAGGMESDDISEFLRIPVLLKSPQLIVDVVMWLDQIVSGVDPGESANMAVVRACLDDKATQETGQDTIHYGTAAEVLSTCRWMRKLWLTCMTTLTGSATFTAANATCMTSPAEWYMARSMNSLCGTFTISCPLTRRPP